MVNRLNGIIGWIRIATAPVINVGNMKSLVPLSYTSVARPQLSQPTQDPPRSVDKGKAKWQLFRLHAALDWSSLFFEPCHHIWAICLGLPLLNGFLFDLSS